MELQGGCYCGAVRYRATGDMMFTGQCHCRECQYISGGQPNIVMGMPESGFSYTKGGAKQHVDGGGGPRLWRACDRIEHGLAAATAEPANQFR